MKKAIVIMLGAALPGGCTKTVVHEPAQTKASIVAGVITDQGITWAYDEATTDKLGEALCEGDGGARDLAPLDNYELLSIIGSVASALGIPTDDAATVSGALIGAYCPDAAGGEYV